MTEVIVSLLVLPALCCFVKSVGRKLFVRVDILPGGSIGRAGDARLYLQTQMGLYHMNDVLLGRPQLICPYNTVHHCMYYHVVVGTVSYIRRTRPARAKSHQKLAGGQNRNTEALSCQINPKTISSMDYVGRMILALQRGECSCVR